MSRAAMQQALEVFERMSHEDSIFAGEFDGEIAALRAALAEPEQIGNARCPRCWEPVTAPTPRKPLTPDQVFAIADQHPIEGFDPEIMAFARAIERKHGIGEQA